jgi:outer membrane lipoprotein-sorting protein
MRWFAAPLATLALFASTPAWADEAGNAVLAQMDAMTAKAKDLTIKYDVVHQEPGAAEPRKLQFTVRVKGEKNVTEFLAPADQKGTRILTLSRTQMYIWLPQFQKLRRVASSSTEMGFMGTTFEYEDMATYSYAGLYDGTIAEDAADHWVIDAVAKPDAAVTFTHLRFTVRKDLQVPTKIEYLAADGTVARTSTRDDYVCDAGVCVFHVMRMTDHRRNDVWTELRMLEWAHDQGLSDDIFTVRALQSGI